MKTSPAAHLEPENVIDSLNLSSIDQLLFHIAHLVLQLGGHRYGSFLEAANTAAKLSVYITYLEHGQSFNRTGLLHHIEPKRVKEIVQEIELLFVRKNGSSGLGHQEPEFLIGIPNLWIAKYPWPEIESPITLAGLSPPAIEAITRQLPRQRPQAKIITEIEFFELLDSMHTIACQQATSPRQKPFSNALREHYAFKVLHSGMAVKIRQSLVDIDLYALVRNSYAPQQVSAKLNTLFSDLVNTIEILQRWVNSSPNVLRALETLEVQPQNQAAAIADLDQILRDWADRHHDAAGQPMILQLAAGPHPMP